MKFIKSLSLCAKTNIYILAICGILFIALVSVNSHLRFKTIETVSHYVCKLNSAQAVVVGDSIGAGGCHWAGYLGLPPLRTINLAGNGYTFYQVSAQIDKAIQYRPKVILVFAGTNDAFAIQANRLSLPELKSDVQKIIESCKGTPCVFVLPPPSKIHEINIILKQVRTVIRSVGDQNGVAFVGAVEGLADSGGIILEKFTTDGVHLTPEAYKARSFDFQEAIAHAISTAKK
jgi:lysophospholipase L1-like esterase